MKILLISSNTATSPYPVYPLGCSIIASVLQQAGHDVKMLDIIALEENFEIVDSEIRNFKPELVGISIRNIDNVNMLEEESFLAVPKKLTSMVHRQFPDTPVVLGGSGFSIMPEHILQAIGADYGIAGEGEQAVLELVETLAKGEKPADKILRSSQPLTGKSIKGAAYEPELISFYQEQGCIMPLQTKRGCLNKCLYCTYPFLEGRDLRTRNPEDVVNDMKILHDDFGADFIFFTDSVFNDAKGEYLKVVDAIKAGNLDIPWTAFFQPDPQLDKDTVKRLIDAGLHSVELGPDATSDETLKAMGKRFKFKDVIRSNQLFADEHIAVANYFMIGGLKETKETVKIGVENIRALDMSVSFVFLGTRILPGTPLYRIALKEGFIDETTDIINPVYYLSPEIDRQWLENYLDDTLGKIKHCIYPPNSMDAGIQILRQMGYRGNLWEMMVKDSKRMAKKA